MRVAPAPIPASAPPRVLDRLRVAPDGPLPVLHAGRSAAYVDLAGWCLGVVTASAEQVPNALRVGGPLAPPATAAVAGGELVLDGRPVRVGRLHRVAAPRLAPRRVRPTLTAAHVARMVGRGDGLTPYDDDVLAGWLATHRAAGVATPEVDAAVTRHAGRTTLLSATLLDCAQHGEVLPQVADLLAAVGTADEPAAAERLARVGHSSGRGMLAGVRWALRDLGLHADTAGEAA